MPAFKKRPVIFVKAKPKSRGTIVVSYLSNGWSVSCEGADARGHTNVAECGIMVEAYRDLGFDVILVDYNNETFVPGNDCKLVVDLHSNLERWDGILSESCIRVLHATGPHWIQYNLSELNRLQGLHERKGVALLPRRQLQPSKGAQFADQISAVGNAYTMETFQFAGKPIARIPISSAYEFPWPDRRNIAEARKKFIWVGSFGMVQKGLDLALDAFAGMPDLELTVCGRPEKEEDFYKLYEKELVHSPNIHFHGWIDMASPDFLEIARTHAAVIYPSSAEGGAGSVIHCMHAGMLPICTTEASIDLGDFGVHVASGTVEAVQKACRAVADMPASEVEKRARAAYEHIRRVHTREQFRENYRKFAERLVEGISI
ncbi:MAG: glycosyltransferase family 4 protein [Terrimicrobiaceae bacterium]